MCLMFYSKGVQLTDHFGLSSKKTKESEEYSVAVDGLDLEAVVMDPANDFMTSKYKKIGKKGKIVRKTALDWDDAPSPPLEVSETKT